MTALRPESVLLNWLIALPFFAALCAAIFPRLRVRGGPADETESLRRGPFALGAMASLMGVSLAVALLPGIPERGAIGTDYWWTRDLYHLRFRADVLAGVLVLGVHALGLLIHLQAAGLPAQAQSHRRASLLLAAQGCAAAACLSADLIALVFFLQLTVIALWLMARQRHEGAADHLLATAHTLGLLFLGAALLLWHRAGETSTGALPFLVMAVEPGALPAIGSLAILGLLPLIVGVPVHGWLPHLATRAPGAARASAVLLPLVGGAALVRVVPGLLDAPAVPALRPLGIALGLAALSWGAIRALLARRARPSRGVAHSDAGRTPAHRGGRRGEPEHRA